MPKAIYKGEGSKSNVTFGEEEGNGVTDSDEGQRVSERVQEYCAQLVKLYLRHSSTGVIDYHHYAGSQIYGQVDEDNIEADVRCPVGSLLHATTKDSLLVAWLLIIDLRTGNDRQVKVAVKQEVRRNVLKVVHVIISTCNTHLKLQSFQSLRYPVRQKDKDIQTNSELIWKDHP